MYFPIFEYPYWYIIFDTVQRDAVNGVDLQHSKPAHQDVAITIQSHYIVAETECNDSSMHDGDQHRKAY